MYYVMTQLCHKVCQWVDEILTAHIMKIIITECKHWLLASKTSRTAVYSKIKIYLSKTGNSMNRKICFEE
jgi:hypothetical protein